MMKCLLVILIIVSSIQLKSDCIGRVVSISPYQDTISTKTVFILNIHENFRETKDPLKDLNVYIFRYQDLNGNELSDNYIRLNVLKVYKGNNSDYNILLKPSTPLLEGKYRLDLDKYPLKPKEWIILEKEEIIPIEKTFLYKGSKAYPMGCGPEMFASFETEYNGIVVAELMEDDNKSFKSIIVSYPYPEEKSKYENIIKIGHGMCGGAFSFKYQSKYKVRFRPMNIEGKFSRNWTVWFEIDNPADILYDH